MINGVALRTIREMKAKDDAAFRGGTFGPTCGMSHVHLINIEKGRRFPREEIVERIAEKLGVPIDAISYVIETAGESAA